NLNRGQTSHRIQFGRWLASTVLALSLGAHAPSRAPTGALAGWSCASSLTKRVQIFERFRVVGGGASHHPRGRVCSQESWEGPPSRRTDNDRPWHRENSINIMSLRLI